MFKRESSVTRSKQKNKLKRNIGLRGLKSILPEPEKMNEETVFNKIKVDYLNSREINLNYYEEKLFDDQFMMYKTMFKEQEKPHMKRAEIVTQKIDNVLGRARRLVRTRKRDRVTKPILKRTKTEEDGDFGKKDSKRKTVRFTDDTVYSELNMQAKSDGKGATGESFRPGSVELKAPFSQDSLQENKESNSSIGTVSRHTESNAESVESQLQTITDRNTRESIRIGIRMEKRSSNVIDVLTDEEIFEAEMSEDNDANGMKIMEEIIQMKRVEKKPIHRIAGKKLPPVPTVKELLKPPIKNAKKIPMINEKKSNIEKTFYLESLSMKQRVQRFQNHLKYLKSNMSNLIGKDVEELKREKMQKFIKNKQTELKHLQTEQERELAEERMKNIKKKKKKKNRFKVKKNMRRRKQSAVQTAALLVRANNIN